MLSSKRIAPKNSLITLRVSGMRSERSGLPIQVEQTGRQAGEMIVVDRKYAGIIAVTEKRKQTQTLDIPILDTNPN